MAKTQFTSVSYQLSDLIGQIDSGQLALPDIQRPFVWSAAKVRDLLDSMYQGYPIGYLMIWNSEDDQARLIGADNKQETPTNFIVDGQQRLTSLYTVLKGTEVLQKDHTKRRIRLAFRPRDARFEVADAANQKDPEFLSDISRLWTEEDWEVTNDFIVNLRESKPEALANGEESALRNALGRLHGLDDYPLSGVKLGPEVDEETVAEIFLRVNSGGTALSQADFILTLLSVFREDDRRRLEHFSAESVDPSNAGASSPFNHLISPDPDQLLRAAILLGFHRGRLQSALALLRGASIEGDETLKRADREAQLEKLSDAISETLDLTNWHEFLKCVVTAGYRRSTEISSSNSLVLVYALYLVGRRLGLSHSELRRPISRFHFMSAISARYSGSFETRITTDVQELTSEGTSEGFLAGIERIIDGVLTNDFWTISLPQSLATSSANSPTLYAYAASLCLLDARVPPFGPGGSAQKPSIPIQTFFDPVLSPKKAAVERHHLFPRAYLKREGISTTRQINQIANLAYVEWPDNIEISDKAPHDYWPTYCDNFTEEDLFNHALVPNWSELPYSEFLELRRSLIAKVIRKGFESIGQAPGDVALAEAAAKDVFLHPDTPFTNDLAIRNVLRGLSGEIFWYEQHMPPKVLEVLVDELSRGDVQDLRLLSGPANVNEKGAKKFVRFAEELGKHGIHCEWRVIPAERARLLHARIISDGETTYEVPPFNSVLAGTVDSVHESEIPLDSFNAAWDSEESKDLGEFVRAPTPA